MNNLPHYPDLSRKKAYHYMLRIPVIAWDIDDIYEPIEYSEVREVAGAFTKLGKHFLYAVGQKEITRTRGAACTENRHWQIYLVTDQEYNTDQMRSVFYEMPKFKINIYFRTCHPAKTAAYCTKKATRSCGPWEFYMQGRNLQITWHPDYSAEEIRPDILELLRELGNAS